MLFGQDIAEQQKQLIAKLRSAANKSLPTNISFTYSQPTRRNGQTPTTCNIQKILQLKYNII